MYWLSALCVQYNCMCKQCSLDSFEFYSQLYIICRVLRIEFRISFSQWRTQITQHISTQTDMRVHECMNDKWCHWSIGRESNSFRLCMRMANWSVRSNDPLSILYRTEESLVYTIRRRFCVVCMAWPMCGWVRAAIHKRMHKCPVRPYDHLSVSSSIPNIYFIFT